MLIRRYRLAYDLQLDEMSRWRLAGAENRDESTKILI
jgi:hypothetical protein